MSDVATMVLATVNAPYGADLSAHQLAAMIVDPKSASEFNAPVFSFFSEVAQAVQIKFIKDMGVNEADVQVVASRMSELSGYTLPLAA